VKICPLHDQTTLHGGVWRRGSLAPCIPDLTVCKRVVSFMLQLLVLGKECGFQFYEPWWTTESGLM